MDEMKVREYVGAVFSENPVPGGGGASAVAASIGVALGGMVGNLTIGKKKYEEVQKEIEKLTDKAEELYLRLLELSKADAEVFLNLMDCFKLPKVTDDEKSKRESAISAALIPCVNVPLEILECCLEGIKLAGEFAEKGNENVISDAGCCAALCLGAAKASVINVFVNTKSIKDKSLSKVYEIKARGILAECENEAESIIAAVHSKIGE
ncbi:MAG: cyclodeaminase/cyclohydrolase family protein [Ruminococcaceae bacterium]|nr:cyclodeaminase/cyclohydrolase family protein [Oscillospiraceae bacterium]